MRPKGIKSFVNIIGNLLQRHPRIKTPRLPILSLAYRTNLCVQWIGTVLDGAGELAPSPAESEESSADAVCR